MGIKKENGKYIINQEEAIEELFKKYFPKDGEEEDIPIQRVSEKTRVYILTWGIRKKILTLKNLKIKIINFKQEGIDLRRHQK